MGNSQLREPKRTAHTIVEEDLQVVLKEQNIIEPHHYSNQNYYDSDSEESSLSTCGSNYEYVDLSEFWNLPTEIQLYTMTFLPLNNFSRIIRVSKSLSNNLLEYNELFTIYYLNDFRSRAIQERKSWVSYSWRDDPPENDSAVFHLPQSIDSSQYFQSLGFYGTLKIIVVKHVNERKRRRKRANMPQPM